MADIEENYEPDASPAASAGAGGKKLPKWFWFAVGGGALLLVLLRGKSSDGSSSSGASSDLLASEVASQEDRMYAYIDSALKAYSAEQSDAWAEFQDMIKELIEDKQNGEVTPPTDPILPPDNRNNPPGDDDPTPPPGNDPPPPPEGHIDLGDNREYGMILKKKVART